MVQTNLVQSQFTAINQTLQVNKLLIDTKNDMKFCVAMQEFMVSGYFLNPELIKLYSWHNKRDFFTTQWFILVNKLGDLNSNIFQLVNQLNLNSLINSEDLQALSNLMS